MSQQMDSSFNLKIYLEVSPDMSSNSFSSGGQRFLPDKSSMKSCGWKASSCPNTRRKARRHKTNMNHNMKKTEASLLWFICYINSMESSFVGNVWISNFPTLEKIPWEGEFTFGYSILLQLPANHWLGTTVRQHFLSWDCSVVSRLDWIGHVFS